MLCLQVVPEDSDHEEGEEEEEEEEEMDVEESSDDSDSESDEKGLEKWFCSPAVAWVGHKRVLFDH